MRIAMVSTPFVSVPPRGYGGTELIVHELVEGLSERGHSVTLFATGDSVVPKRATLRYTFDEPQWPPKPLPELLHVARAIEDITAREFDVVHCHSASALAFDGLVDVPFVYTIHHPLEQQLSRFYQRFPHVRYVAISADQAAREVGLPVAQVIHHGLDPDRYDWKSEGSDRLCFIGRFAPFKGLHTAIDVAAEVGRPIDVAGSVHEVDGDYGSREVEPRLLQPHVAYLGVIGIDTKRPLLAQAAALVFPITWNEPFGLVMIEAMLSGCPVVAFPQGSVPEVVDPGVTGFVVRDAEELADVVRRGGPIDSFDREKCRRRAVERFGRERMVSEHVRLYEAATRGRSQADAVRVERRRPASARYGRVGTSGE